MRLVKRSFFVLAMTMSVALVACGNSSGDDDDDILDPTGTDTTWIVDSLTMPTSASEATTLGVNLDGDELGRIDNALGQIMAALAGAAGDSFNINETIDTSVRTGSLMLLIRMKATSLVTATGVGMWIYLGENEDPPACIDESDTACGRHLAGDGSASIKASSPTDTVVVGKNIAGRFSGGPGTLSIEFALTEGPPITVELIGAHAIGMISEATITDGIIAGAITDDDLQNEVLPAVHAGITSSVADDCTGTIETTCCDDGSTGATIVGLFDTMPADCTVTLEEVRNSNLIKSLLTPDVDLLDANGDYNPRSDGEKDSLSLGVGFTAVSGTFAIPPQ